MPTGRSARHRRGKGPAGVLAALGILLVLAALALPVLERGTGPVQLGHGSTVGAGQTPTGTARPESASVAAGPRQAGHRVTPTATVARSASPVAGRPVRVAIPALAVSAPVIPVQLEGTALVPPSDPQVVGWWSTGGVPGAGRGTAVVTGHTVHTGGGAFDDLADLSRGDLVRLSTESGVIVYTVRTVTVYSKASLADHAHDVFSQTVPGRLALVTCDDWNGTIYESNAVVIATPLRS